MSINIGVLTSLYTHGIFVSYFSGLSNSYKKTIFSQWRLELVQGWGNLSLSNDQGPLTKLAVMLKTIIQLQNFTYIKMSLLCCLPLRRGYTCIKS